MRYLDVHLWDGGWLTTLSVLHLYLVTHWDKGSTTARYIPHDNHDQWVLTRDLTALTTQPMGGQLRKKEMLIATIVLRGWPMYTPHEMMHQGNILSSWYTNTAGNAPALHWCIMQTHRELIHSVVLAWMHLCQVSFIDDGNSLCIAEQYSWELY